MVQGSQLKTIKVIVLNTYSFLLQSKTLSFVLWPACLGGCKIGRSGHFMHIYSFSYLIMLNVKIYLIVVTNSFLTSKIHLQHFDRRAIFLWYLGLFTYFFLISCESAPVSAHTILNVWIRFTGIYNKSNII